MVTFKDAETSEKFRSESRSFGEGEEAATLTVETQ